MSLNLNKVLLAGNLTRDPQVRIAGKSSVADFGLAINRRYKSGDEKKEETTFVDVECWGTTAEMVGQYLTKGRGVYIEGRLKLDQWDDKESGQKRSKLKIVADTVQFIDGPKTASGEPTVAQSSRAPASRPGDNATPVKPAAATGSGKAYDVNSDEPPFSRHEDRSW